MDKKFIFKYEPQSSVKEMFSHLEETVKTGKKYIQPKNVSVINDLAVVSRILNKTRLEIFLIIKKKQPNNIHDLSQFVQRDYANVWRDCQMLANCGIIELKEKGKENKPIALYDQIVISCVEELGQPTKPKTFKKISQHSNWLHSFLLLENKLC
jgi:predicted transcriptional regulator